MSKLPTLIINTGSSTFKWTLFEAGERVVATGTEAWSAEDALTRASQIAAKLRSLPPCQAIGHRVVHGAELFRDTIPIQVETRRELESLLMLDPVHMRPALCGIDAALEVFPQTPQFAVFDTAFHHTLGEAAAGYGLPHEWSSKWHLRRYGFHGLSVAWSIEWVRRTFAHVPRRVIVAHLGGGCSVTAVLDGQSIDTTMGFTPLEGLMMGTRSGSVDAGLLMHLQARCGVSLLELEDTLTNRSGLLGVSGVSADLRQVLAAAAEGNENAKLAYDRFILFARRGVGAMAGALGGVNMLIFTGGIGEHQPGVRRDIAAAFGEGLIDEARNESTKEGEVSPAASPLQVAVVCAREDVMVQREVLRLSGSRT